MRDFRQWRRPNYLHFSLLVLFLPFLSCPKTNMNCLCFATHTACTIPTPGTTTTEGDYQPLGHGTPLGLWFTWGGAFENCYYDWRAATRFLLDFMVEKYISADWWMEYSVTEILFPGQPWCDYEEYSIEIIPPHGNKTFTTTHKVQDPAGVSGLMGYLVREFQDHVPSVQILAFPEIE